MIYLLLSILLNGLLFLIFKYFGVFKVNNLNAVWINYIVAGAIGVGFSLDYDWASVFVQPWIWSAVGLSVLFFGIFMTVALVAQRVSVAASSVVNKLSVVIPVVAAYFLYDDHFTWLKILGVLLALVAVYFATAPDKNFDLGGNWFLIFVLFVGSGIIDTVLKYTQTNLLEATDVIPFSAACFLLATIPGAGYITVSKSWQLDRKSLLAGIVLGIPNFFSIYFVIQTLQQPNWESSFIFPVNNVGVVLFALTASLFLFREKLSTKNILGVLIAVLSIAILTLERL